MVCPHVTSFKPTFLSVMAYSCVIVNNYNKYMLVIKKEVKTYLRGPDMLFGPTFLVVVVVVCVHSEVVVLVMVAVPITAPCIVHVVLIAVGGVGCSR